MGFFDDLKAKAGEIHGKLTDEVKKFANKDFHEAVVAACAVIAAADGDVSSDEKKKMMGFMGVNETMKLFDKHKTIQIFAKYIDQMEFDFDIGRDEAMNSIAKLNGKANESRAVVRLACVIGAADGDFDDDEKGAAREICKVLDVDPSAFDL
jgi:tellurite resistance protein TerB